MSLKARIMEHRKEYKDVFKYHMGSIGNKGSASLQSLKHRV